MRTLFKEKNKRIVPPNEALDRLSKSYIHGTENIYRAGTATGLATGAVAFNLCPTGIIVSGYVGALAGNMVRLKVENIISSRTLRKRLEAAVGRPNLALRLSERYDGFPEYQKAILRLGNIKPGVTEWQVGFLAESMVETKAERVKSERTLRKSLHKAIGRPNLAHELSLRYDGFPGYQAAILELGKIKLGGTKKQMGKQREKLAAAEMNTY